MAKSDAERLAVIETNTIEILRRLDEQKEHNKTFYQTHKKVLVMEAKALGVWWTIGIFGTLTTVVSGAVASAVSYFKQ